jgi:hypothetical protein
MYNKKVIAIAWPGVFWSDLLLFGGTHSTAKQQ